MPRLKIWNQLVQRMLPIVILAIGVGLLVLMMRKPPQAAEDPPARLLPLVQTLAVEPHEGRLDLEVDGVVVPYREVEVSAEVGGRVVEKSELARAGRYVTRGTLLYQIEPRDYEIERHRLEAQLAQAEASLDELDVETENTGRLIQLAREDQQLAGKEVLRLDNLSDGRYVSESELDRARKTELVARNALTTLENQLALSEARRRGLQSARQLVAAQLEQAKLNLARTKVTAPVDGVIVEHLVESNAYVQPGSVLATIEDTSAVEVTCRLRMEELAWIWRQPQAQVAGARLTPAGVYEIPQTAVTVQYYYADRPEVVYAWRGHLSRYEGVGLDEQTRTVPCRVLVEAPHDVQVLISAAGVEVPPLPALVRGMYVTVQLHVEAPHKLVRISELGLKPGKTVWLAREGRLRVVESVKLVEHEPRGNGGGYWVVDGDASGISVDDRLIVSPLTVVHDGMPIREQPQSESDYPLGRS